MEEIVIQEKCVPVEIAKMLKRCGYDDKISMFYMYNPPWTSKGGIQKGNSYTGPYGGYANLSNSDWEKRIHEMAKALRFEGKHPPISAPSYDMVIDWILENHNYFIMVDMMAKDNFRFAIINADVWLCNTDEKDYQTRYAAMDAAFKRILKAIKASKNSEITKKFLESIKKENKDGQAKND